MRCALLVAVLLVVLAPQAVAAPKGAPTSIGAARAGDNAAHPAALHEWWSLRLVDPSSRAWLEIAAEREYDARSVELVGVDTEGRSISDSFGTPELSGSAGTLRAGGGEGTLTVRLGKGEVKLAAPHATGRLRLRGMRRGPAAGGWRLGTGFRLAGSGFRPVTFDGWSMLVASSTVRGELMLGDGRRLAFDGWRASFEHGWGDILSDDHAWDFWDQAVIHARKGVTWVAYGLNRIDTVTGPGATDAQWLGLLARVDRHGVRVCRPRVDRRRWMLDSDDLAGWSTLLTFSCRGLKLTYRDGAVALVDESGSLFEVRGRTRGRRPGFSMHLAHARI